MVKIYVKLPSIGMYYLTKGLIDKLITYQNNLFIYKPYFFRNLLPKSSKCVADYRNIYILSPQYYSKEN